MRRSEDGLDRKDVRDLGGGSLEHLGCSGCVETRKHITFGARRLNKPYYTISQRRGSENESELSEEHTDTQAAC